MENEQEVDDLQIIEEAEEVEEEVVEEVETPEAKEPKKKEFTPEQKLARVNRMKAKLEKELGIVEPKKVATKTGELDETQLDYLDLKGISDQDEIDIIQRVMERTGQTVRQVLKDDYVQAKLESLRKEREVKDATPSATKRGAGQVDDVASALARYEATGKLPDDYKLRSAVVNKIEERVSNNKPAWQK